MCTLRIPSVKCNAFCSSGGLRVPRAMRTCITASIGTKRIVLRRIANIVPTRANVVFDNNRNIRGFIISTTATATRFRAGLLENAAAGALVAPRTNSACCILRRKTVNTNLCVTALARRSNATFCGGTGRTCLLIRAPISRSRPMLAFHFNGRSNAGVRRTRLGARLPAIVCSLANHHVVRVIRGNVCVVGNGGIIIG